MALPDTRLHVPGRSARGDVVGDRGHRFRRADDAHVIDAVDQLDVNRRRDAADRFGIFVRNHQFVVGAGEDRQRPGHGRQIGAVAPRAEIAPQPVGIGRHQDFSGVRRHRKGQRRQRLATVDADVTQHLQRKDARDIGAGPAAGIRPVGRGVVAEIRREQHGAREQVLDRRCRHAQREAAAGRMADQRQRRGWIRSCAPRRRNRQDHPRAGRHSRYRPASLRRRGREYPPHRSRRPRAAKRIRQRMNARTRAGRAVNQDGDPPNRRAARRIMAVSQFSAVARLKKLDPRHRAAIHSTRGFGDRDAVPEAA